jgi:hypothetical protein
MPAATLKVVDIIASTTDGLELQAVMFLLRLDTRVIPCTGSRVVTSGSIANSTSKKERLLRSETKGRDDQYTT